LRCWGKRGEGWFGKNLDYSLAKYRVVSVSIANPYQFPRIAGEKATIVDVRATDQSGRKFVVEMQVADKTGFDKRVQYYISRDYSMQIDQGENYPLLHPAYFSCQSLSKKFMNWRHRLISGLTLSSMRKNYILFLILRRKMKV